MKKFLLTAALILALVTSLTAGTMAAYTSNVDTITGVSVTTKTWDVKAEAKDTKFTMNVNLAPGDKAEYTITVKNASEVSATIDMEAALAKNAPAGLTISCDTNAKIVLGVNQSKIYKFTVEYDYDEGKIAGAATTFDIKLNATSVDEGKTASGVAK